MSACNRYVLTKNLRKSFSTRGIPLICKICDVPIDVGEQVESKQQKNGKLKIYHGTCYDESFLDV